MNWILRAILLAPFLLIVCLPFHGAAQNLLDEATSLQLRLLILDQRGGGLPWASPSAATRGDEGKHAREELPRIEQDAETFHTIVQHLGLGKFSVLGEDEKLLVYREYTQLHAIHLEPQGNKFKVTIEGSNEFPSCSEQTKPCSDEFIDRQGHITSMGVMEPIHDSLASSLRDDNPQPESASPGPTRSREILVEKLPFPGLRLQLIERFGEPWLCPLDSGTLPVVIDERKRERAAEIQAFPEIQADDEMFRVIAKLLGLNETSQFSDDQKLLAFREYERLKAIRMERLINKYEFSVRVRGNWSKGVNNGLQISGLIDPQGRIEILRIDRSSVACP